MGNNRNIIESSDYMKKKKIIFVIENLNAGGAERVFVNLLKKFDRKKFECILVLINSGNIHKGSYEVVQDIKVINLEKNKKLALFSLIKTIKKENPDVVFSNLAPINILCLVSKLLIRNKNTKYIIRETTIKSISINQTKERKLSKLVYKMLIKIFYNYADGIISLSKGTKEDLIKNFGIMKEKINVIYNPIDIDEIKAKSKEPITDIEIHSDTINLICVGSLVKSKGHKYLIKAIYKLKEIYGYKVRAYFLGTGELETYLKQLVIKYKLENDIIFLGFKSNPFKYMSKCDIFVLPAIWEGFGNVIVEAMVCNTPVVSTNSPSGPREIIDDKVNGILAEPKNVDSLVDAIISIIDNPEYYNYIRDNGYKRANDFEINKITKEYENYILSILD